MRKANEVAEILEKIYEKKFLGKEYGRFKIPKTSFKELCQRKNLRESFLNNVIEEAIEVELVVIPLEHTIVVVKEDVITNCRTVPEDIIAEYEERDDEDCDDFEDEFEEDEEEESDDFDE